jgi:hypothetical protein
MRTRLALLPILAALAACATMPDVAQQDAAPPPGAPIIGGVASAIPTDCPLTIVFGSYAMGIDQPARARIEALLASDRGVTGFQAHRWGREGEVTLCVRTRAPADATRLFARARVLVPPRPRGPVSLRTASGLTYETPPLER